MSNKKNHRFFPVRQKNQFKLLINSSEFYPAIINAINNANSEIIIENYLTNSGQVFNQFITVLLQAAKRNVKVYCLFDSYGSKGISRKDLLLLDVKNIYIQFYNKIKYYKYLKNLFRDHRKIFIIDRNIVFIGGAGLSDEFDINLKQGWHDIMLSIKGEITQDWFILFQRNWANTGKIALNKLFDKNIAITSQLPLTQTGKVIETSAPHKHEINKLVLQKINTSKQSIWLTTPYFVPSRKLRRFLIRAADRGVDVKLLLPGTKTDHSGVRIMGQRYYAGLLRHDVKIFEYSKHFSHAKALLCDQWTTIGSSNFDRWNFRWNLEANQVIADPSFSLTLQHWFEQELRQCNEIFYDQWRNRTQWQRMKEWYWGKVIIILEKLKRPKN